jgi:hypothetical protein
MENLIQFTPSTGPTASDDLAALFERHRLICQPCQMLKEDTCSICRCVGVPWKRPRCPAGRWWDQEYNAIIARL